MPAQSGRHGTAKISGGISSAAPMPVPATGESSADRHDTFVSHIHQTENTTEIFIDKADSGG
jgi:hypothetical protein